MKLTGPILDYVRGMPLLETLAVPGNRFTGTFSASFAEEHPKIVFIDLGRNNFTGTIPEGLDTLPYLTELQLPANGFSGPIPSSLGDSKICT